MLLLLRLIGCNVPKKYILHVFLNINLGAGMGNCNMYWCFLGKIALISNSVSKVIWHFTHQDMEVSLERECITLDANQSIRRSFIEFMNMGYGFLQNHKNLKQD